MKCKIIRVAPLVPHNPSCDEYARDAEENKMRKKSLVDKT